MILTIRTPTLIKLADPQPRKPRETLPLPVMTQNTSMFQAGTDPPPREQWDVAPPVNFSDLPGIARLIHQIDEAFQSTREIATPFGDTGQTWGWSDVGSCHMPRAPPMYPTLTVGTGSMQRPVASSVDHTKLFTWITDNLAWLFQYDTIYVFVDNRELPGNNCPEYWPYFAPWIKGRCEVVGPYQERTTAIYVPICPATGLDQVHFTWAGTFVLEALCTVYPTLNFALMDSDCVPTTLFEIAELVNLMADQTSRAEALQSYTMASARDCPPAVLLMTESKAELNAGLVVVTWHMPVPTTDVDMAHGSDTPSQAAPSGLSSEQADQGTTADECDARAPKSRRIATPADRKSPAEWMAKLCASRTDFLPLSQPTHPMLY